MAEKNERETILVTGVSKGLGAMIARQAYQAGYEVIGADESAPSREWTIDPADLRVGDLSDPEFLSSCVRSADHVINGVIDNRPRASYSKLAAMNIDLPKRLYEAATASGCRTFVHLSSARICAATGRYVSEGDRVEATNPYEQTLYDAEIQLRGLANRTEEGPRLVVLRTAALYGHTIPPDGAPWLAVPPILSLYFDLLPGLSGGPRTHWVHAVDVARATVHLVKNGEGKRTETYHIADDSPLSMGEFINLLIEVYGYNLGVKIPFPSVPVMRQVVSRLDKAMVLRGIDGLLHRWWDAVREKYPIRNPYEPKLSPESLATALKDVTISNDHLKQTGFELSYPSLAEGLKDVVETYQKLWMLPDPDPGIVDPGSGRTRIGSSLVESLSGSWGDPRVPGSPSYPIDCHLRVTTPESGLVTGEHAWDLDGRITMEGFATEAELQGTLDHALFGRKRLVYQFSFSGDDGRWYRLEGVKRVRYLDLVGSLSQMTFTVTDPLGNRVARGEMSFEPRREWLSLLKSVRLKRVVGSRTRR